MRATFGWMTSVARRLLAIAHEAFARCSGDRLVREALQGRARAPLIVGAGKAVGAMADGAWAALGHRFRPGPLIGKHPGPIGIDVVIANHPLPDARGEHATQALLEELHRLPEEDEVLLLLSGGASALLAGPIDGVSMEALRKGTEQLLRCGAPIAEINTVRRHLGIALGGKLALATRAHIEVLALSDVIGNRAHDIGSGPASGDPTSFAEALYLAQRCGLGDDLVGALKRGVQGQLPENPRPDDPRLTRVVHRLLASPETLRATALELAIAAGFAAEAIDPLVEGDVHDLAQRYGELARRLPRGHLLVAVGEPTVCMQREGRGGRCQQLALLFARAVQGLPVLLCAVGSDGSDGPTDAAGAIVDGSTWAIAIQRNLDPDGALSNNDAYPLLDALSVLVRTGPTGTNLLDLHLLATD